MKSQHCLLVIDVQQAFEAPTWGQRNNPLAEQNIQALLHHWRNVGGKIIHIQHLSDNPSSLFFKGSETAQFKPEAQPLSGETVVSKKVNSAFIGTDLQQKLKEQHIDTLYIVGLTTPHCVSTTTRMAANLGFNCFLVEDATASFELTDHRGVRFTPQEIQDVTLATLHEEFAKIISTNDAIKQVLLETRSDRSAANQ